MVQILDSVLGGRKNCPLYGIARCLHLGGQGKGGAVPVEHEVPLIQYLRIELNCIITSCP